MDESANAGVEIIDLQGKVVQSYTDINLDNGQQIYKLNVNHLTKGVYTIQLKIGDEYHYEKFIKQ